MASKVVGRLFGLGVNNGMRTLALKHAHSIPRRIASPANERAPAARGPMPQEAREGLERALCGVLERRHPGRRFAMKRELDPSGERPASAADAHSLKDAA